MTQDEIIEMARQAGLHLATDVNWMPIIGLEYAEKLIALARADTSMKQDEIIEMVRQAKAIPIHKDFNQLALIGIENIEAFAKLVAQNDQKEIERLRALCYEMLSELYAYRASKHLKEVTATIRARGQV